MSKEIDEHEFKCCDCDAWFKVWYRIEHDGSLSEDDIDSGTGFEVLAVYEVGCATRCACNPSREYASMVDNYCNICDSGACDPITEDEALRQVEDYYEDYSRSDWRDMYDKY